VIDTIVLGVLLVWGVGGTLILAWFCPPQPRRQKILFKRRTD
jgi:hypothetical protein